jgi:hypothetical protein
LSSPALNPQPGKRPRGYCVRPEDEPKNTGLPRYGYWMQHAMIATDGATYDALKSLGATKVKGGYLVKNASVTSIANASGPFTWNKEPLPRRTAGHRLIAMAEKGIIRRWDVATNTPALASSNSPFGTCWFIPLWGDVLQTWANDPNIGTVSNVAFFTQGKAKKFLSPDALVRWNIDAAVAAQSPAAQSSCVQLLPEASAPGQQPATAAPTLGDDLDTVHRAILDLGVQATDAQAATILELAREIEPTIPAE